MLVVVSLSSQLLCRRVTSRYYYQHALFSRSTLLSKLSTGSANMSGDDGKMPTDKGMMTLYSKSGPNPPSVGDCPFAQYVKIVLHETKTPYESIYCNNETKPRWLVEQYNGAMPALRHEDRCIVESDDIAQYVNSLKRGGDNEVKSGNEEELEEAKLVTQGFFPAMAKYLKHTPDGDEDDVQLKKNLDVALQKFEDYLTTNKKGPYWVGDGMDFTMLDCSLSPKLFHLMVGLKSFKGDAIDLERDYPAVWKYLCCVLDRESVKEALCSEETVVWGWSAARSSL